MTENLKDTLDSRFAWIAPLHRVKEIVNRVETFLGTDHKKITFNSISKIKYRNWIII